VSRAAHFDMASGIRVIEFDAIGHRLAFVRSILDDGTQAGVVFRVVTTAAARDSAEWREHIGDATAGPAVQLEQEPRGMWQYARLVKCASPCVVLESDAHLPALILARLFGARFGMLVTRPITPKSDRAWRWRTRGKAMLCMSLRILGVNVRLLVSPFVTDHPWAEVAVPSRLRLPTIADPPLIPQSPSSRAEARRVLGIDPRAKVWAVAGAINYTKGLPVILGAMASLAPEHHLVVAGRQDDETRAEIARLGSGLATAGRLTTIDRILTDDELADVLRAADGVLVTKDSGLSSGIAIGSIANGTRVICDAVNPRRGPGFVTFDGSADSLVATLSSLDVGEEVAADQLADAPEHSLLTLLPFGGSLGRGAAMLR
jgi:glycosyltransferase involved in cell wall biosynthesis